MPTQAPMAPKVQAALEAAHVPDTLAREAASEVGELQSTLTELRWKQTFLLWLVPLMFTVMLAGFGVVINLLFRLIAAR